MWQEIRDREAGKLCPNLFSNRIKSTRIQTLKLSNHEDIISPHSGSVNSLQLYLTEGRYLLSGAYDASAVLATSHVLIAAGTEDVQVRLCDIASGAFAHTLFGHRGLSLNM
ncbi:hypothetical protein TB1_042330 [Malus domestica]